MNAGPAEGAVDLGRIGVWSRELRYHPDAGARAAAAAELEGLGYSAIFIPDVGGDVLDTVERLLASTSRIALATGILNIWMHDPSDVAAGRAAIEARHARRFMLGLGASHAAVVDAGGTGTYRRPYTKMRSYLDALDAAAAPVPAPARMLAALGPRMLGLSRERSAGAHPYLVPPEHSAVARAALGRGPLLAPEQAVLLEQDPARARERARGFVAPYLGLPNYVVNLRRLGFGEDDLSGGGSDRLVDALVAWGDEEAIAARVTAHHEAGADHVCIYVFGGPEDALQLDAWRRLAPVLAQT